MYNKKVVIASVVAAILATGVIAFAIPNQAFAAQSVTGGAGGQGGAGGAGGNGGAGGVSVQLGNVGLGSGSVSGS
ncbi:MAG TPA: hypothetical protein VN922_18450, partial [Bacteroidia bacterium]|nr:hypothetical protein [Bacteroidia bacterium]